MSKANRLGSWHPPGNLQGEMDYHLLISDTGNFCAFLETTYLSLIKNLLKAQVSRVSHFTCAQQSSRQVFPVLLY